MIQRSRYTYDLIIVPLALDRAGEGLLQFEYLFQNEVNMISNCPEESLEALIKMRHERGLAAFSREIEFRTEGAHREHRIWQAHEIDAPRVPLESTTIGQYKHSCLGGSFDHLHAGHKILLTAAALVTSDTVHIGISGAFKGLSTKKEEANMNRSRIEQL
eukprot:m.121056 g.121056  ORF g.121056 m.121056 type:complete len:160 (+) comp15516_c0_seq1:127-606(+)